MKLPYGYVLVDGKIFVHEEKVDVVRSIFEYYLAGASLGKVIDMLDTKKFFPCLVIRNGANAKYIPIIGVKAYLNAQFERELRSNADYDKAGHPRKAVRCQFPFFEIN